MGWTQLAFAQASTTADVVYGQQGSFTASGTNDPNGVSASSDNGFQQAVFDSNGNVYAADTGNSRILFFSPGSTTATQVYGQLGSFTSNTQNNGGISANSLMAPYDLALDRSGNLYVADSYNNRVLFYPAGSTTATRVYGQLGSFTTNTLNKGGISANSLWLPQGVILDSNGNLYIGDFGNNRVLFYPAGSTTATRVYGQGGSFTTNTVNKGGISASSLYQPQKFAMDPSGNLYVADYGNSRVLVYPSGSTTATRVYGQGGSFTTNTVNKGGISANSLWDPYGEALDSAGNLYIVDNRNHRALFYPVGSTTATQVYGQLGSFTTNIPVDGGVTANDLFYPEGINLDSNGNLYIADSGENRMLVYPPTTTPGIYSPVNQSTLPGNSVTFWWAGYPGASNYWLDVGSSYAGNNYLQSGPLPNTQVSLPVTTLPSDGSTVYVTWWYEVGGSWSNIEYQYTAFNAAVAKGVLTTPTPGSTFSGSSVTFDWTAGLGASNYWLDVGSTVGGNQYYQSQPLGNVLTVTVNNLPTNGSPVYVTLYTFAGGQWLSTGYTYTAYNINAPSPLSFLAAVNYPSGYESVSVAVGDFNGDGKSDLAVSDLGNDVSILLGIGNGTFHPAVYYGAGSGPVTVAVGDLNGDGKLDLVLADYDANSVGVMLGKGDGTFQPVMPYAAGPGIYSAAVGDFNGDGKLDVVTANYHANNVSVLLGNGDGTLQPASDYSTGSGPVWVSVGDFNGDGKLDLAVANNSGSVSVLLGNGDGTFQPAANYVLHDGLVAVSVGDFNGDGKLDLAVANNAGSLTVLLGNGDGTFQPLVTYSAQDPQSVAVGDFNGDGKLDLAVTSNAGAATVFLGNGDGTFQSAGNFAADTGSQSVAVGDFNGDGKPDMAVANFTNADLSILLNSTPFLAPAHVESPQPKTVLTGSSVTFQWDACDQASAYWIDVGSTPGGNQYYQSRPLSTSTFSAKVTGLPTNSSPVYVTMYSLINGQWQNNQYTYTSAP
jgi:sugar lactone lactonase YvrE